MTGKSDHSLWAVSQKTPCCLADRRKETPAAVRKPRAFAAASRLSSLPRPRGLMAGTASRSSHGPAPACQGWRSSLCSRSELMYCDGQTSDTVWMNLEGRRLLSRVVLQHAPLPPHVRVGSSSVHCSGSLWPTAAGICLHARSAAMGQPEKQEHLLGFPQTSMRALPRLPQPPTSRGHCWDRMGACPTLENLGLLWDRWILRRGLPALGRALLRLCRGAVPWGWGTRLSHRVEGKVDAGAQPARRTWLKSPN